MARAGKLHRYARQIATKLGKGKPPSVHEEMLAYLDENLVFVFDCLDAFVEQIRHDNDNADALAVAYLMLLSIQLEQLRYRIDSKYDWAEGVLEEFQQTLVSRARDGQLPGAALSAIAAALHQARLRPSPEFIAVNEELMGAEAPEDIAPADVDSLLEEIAREHGDDVFSIADSMAEASHAMPAEFRSNLAGHMAQCPFPAIREAAALTVLDPDKDVRHAVALSLAACAEALTPIALRRLIVIRNWLPEDERALIDQAVQAARAKGVDCASWPSGEPTEVRASAVDGSGAQGFLAVSREGKRYRLSSVLMKEAAGVLDAWSGEPSSKRQITRTFDEASDSTPLLAVSRGLLDRAVCHHLAIGLENGAVPPFGLIQVAENTGATDWRPAGLDWREEVDTLVGQLPEHLLMPDQVTEILQTSDEWAAIPGLSDSWFEDDQEVRDLLAKHGRRQVDKLIRRILEEVLEKRRLKWAERFLWIALWLKEGPPDLALPWAQFAVLARELAQGRPVAEIPLMEQIAVSTVIAPRD